MPRQETYKTKFVDRMLPDDMLEDGVLYVAPHFQVAVHKCMCGCGEKVVTPLEDNGWAWSYDGSIKAVTLAPSVGNFQQPCKSHYFLTHGRVHWV